MIPTDAVSLIVYTVILANSIAIIGITYALIANKYLRSNAHNLFRNLIRPDPYTSIQSGLLSVPTNNEEGLSLTQYTDENINEFDNAILLPSIPYITPLNEDSDAKHN